MNLVTKEDLFQFKEQLLTDIESLLNRKQKGESIIDTEGIKTKHVRKMLGCCYNTLQSLRIAGKIRWKKVGGTVYYHPGDVKQLVQDGFQ